MIEALGREGVSEYVKEGGKRTDHESGREVLEDLAPRSPVPQFVKGQLPTHRTEIYLVTWCLILLRCHAACIVTFN